MPTHPRVIEAFTGQYRYLSNFFILETPIKFQNRIFITSEHMYQAAKSTDPADWDRVLFVTNADGTKRDTTPGEAKRIGKTVKLRPDWDKVRIPFMTEIIDAKFTQNPELIWKIWETRGCKLIEGNTWGDTFWGICNGVGENNLGKILMNFRDVS